MKNVKPRIQGQVLRAAENQPEYTPVDILLARNIDYTIPVDKDYNTVIMAFELTGEERQRIINGEDVYVALLTYGHPQQPIMLSVGPEEMAEWHGLEVDRRSAAQRLADERGLAREHDRRALPQGDGAPTDAEGPEAL